MCFSCFTFAAVLLIESILYAISYRRTMLSSFKPVSASRLIDFQVGIPVLIPAAPATYALGYLWLRLRPLYAWLNSVLL
jgi:hypothetical protein